MIRNELNGLKEIIIIRLSGSRLKEAYSARGVIDPFPPSIFWGVFNQISIKMILKKYIYIKQLKTKGLGKENNTFKSFSGADDWSSPQQTRLRTLSLFCWSSRPPSVTLPSPMRRLFFWRTVNERKFSLSFFRTR